MDEENQGKDKVKILILEDEGIVAMDLEESLISEGYEVVGIANSGREALMLAKQYSPDLILFDIHVSGDLDGIETATELKKLINVPLIYLTAYTDSATIERAKTTFPSAYLAKPFQAANLRLAIEIALNNFAARRFAPDTAFAKDTGIKDKQEPILFFNNSIFIKQNYKFIKLMLDDIYYLQAENNHVYIFTDDKKYILRQALNTLLERFNWPDLIRIHRSYAININKVNTFNESNIFLDQTAIPMGRSFKD